MATQLLIQGQGGGERGEKSDVRSQNYEIPLLRGMDGAPQAPDGVCYDDDRSPFTREQKIQITRSVNDALTISRNTEERRYVEVTRRSEEGNVEAKRELEVMKTLREVVKPASPKNVFEHVKIVRDDMQRVFTSPAAREGEKVSQLPTEFALSQNYPNPFNPVTKINYEIPITPSTNLSTPGVVDQSPLEGGIRGVKVGGGVYTKLIVYDILGREVIKLVDELKKPGRYTIEFNGTNLSSGVYFYRIEAEDYVMAKKMVLVK
jgi:hypothetical protein